MPVSIVQVDRGYHGELPAHLIAIGAASLLRNVLCANGQTLAQPGWLEVTPDPVNANPVMYIFQVFRTPYVGGDAIHLITKDKLKVWLPGVSAHWDDLTPLSGWVAFGNARPTSTLDHDGNPIVATSRGVYWSPLSGNTTLGIPAATDPTNPPDFRVLDGLADERVKIESAWVASHFEPHVMLARLKQDGQQYVSRYAWSDTNNSIVWFPGFDEASGITSVAGFADLPADVSHETPQILAMEQLRDLLIIYTDWNVWTLQFVGAPLMWVRRMVQGECGLASSASQVNCGDKHYFYGRDGHFYEFNGTDKQNIGLPIEDYVNKNVVRNGMVYGFRRYVPDSCVWAFSTNPDLPEVADTAVAFNRQSGAWTIEDFPFTACRSVDQSGVTGTLGAALTYADLDADNADYDALDDAYSTYSAMEDINDTRDTTARALDIEVMGDAAGKFYYRTGWTQNGEDREHTWRSGIFDFGEQHVVKHLSTVEVSMTRDSQVNHGQSVPAGFYRVNLNVYASNIREAVFTSPIVETHHYRPDSGDDPVLGFRVTARFMGFEITSTSVDGQDRPWALGRLTPALIPMGLR